MRRHLIPETAQRFAGACVAALLSASVADAQSCRPQPMPAPIESLGELQAPADSIAFSAWPSLSASGPWVVRLSRRGRDAKLEVVRLRRQSDCNIWDVASRWEVPVAAAEYASVSEAVAPWLTLPAGFPRHRGPDEIVLDGTGLELRLSTLHWQIARRLNQFERGGQDLSAIFRRLLLLAQIPADELPTDDWRLQRLPH